MSHLSDAHSQRLHDLRGTLSNFKSILTLLKSGYRFDDADAPGALEQLEKAIQGLSREIGQLEKEWQAPSKL